MHSSMTFNDLDVNSARIEMSGPQYVGVSDARSNRMDLLCHVEVVRRMAVVCGLIEPAPVEVPESMLSEVGTQLAAEIKAIDEAA